jgi:hypothetical protein
LRVIVEEDFLEGEPIKAISCLQPEHEWESGFALFAGPPDEDPDTTLVCLNCLIEDHPEITHDLELARQHGQSGFAGWRGAAEAAPRKLFLSV